MLWIQQGELTPPPPPWMIKYSESQNISIEFLMLRESSFIATMDALQGKGQEWNDQGDKVRNARGMDS